ncbi:hypothetical protein [Dyadobacter chenhuakuii]|uniref:Uncharacterized protein n=1 Tax=Dyadobacter chenhuakuii TaxID=2909339 RepID=A0ABY4XLV1_9BACT|nr:hypothetical protein [Dyadobacter chenhuakuii]MCF2494305.1 hypothetical protein [Dyadobacter chenhuakuii]USJ31429.1 hypothetical protein NFI80_01545 [Dyadobacter chenhuakuii]
MSFLHLKFSGWFQCRLATTPDPPDDARGTRGAMRALPGEPDFDRIIRFQDTGQFRRSHTPPIAVKVDKIFGPAGAVLSHPLIDAQINLEDSPVFKGENGIVAGEALEPIVPFKISVTKNSLKLTRGSTQGPPKYPFASLRPHSFASEPGKVAESTKIYNYPELLVKRTLALEQEITETLESPKAVVIQRRIDIIRQLLPTRCEELFQMTLTYHIGLDGSIECSDPNTVADIDFNERKQWIAQFWIGGWDFDVACMYINGYLSIPVSKY